MPDARRQPPTPREAALELLDRDRAACGRLRWCEVVQFAMVPAFNPLDTCHASTIGPTITYDLRLREDLVEWRSRGEWTVLSAWTVRWERNAQAWAASRRGAHG